MKPKLTIAIITALLLMASVSGLVAQDKYDFIMISEVQTQGGKIYIATSTATDYKEEVISTKSFDMRELLKRITEYSEQGWEVYNTEYASAFMMQNACTYFLRKKKQ